MLIWCVDFDWTVTESNLIVKMCVLFDVWRGLCYEEEHFNDDILFESDNAVWWVRGVACFLLIVSMLLDSMEIVAVWFLALWRTCWANLAAVGWLLVEFGFVVGWSNDKRGCLISSWFCDSSEVAVMFYFVYCCLVLNGWGLLWCSGCVFLIVWVGRCWRGRICSIFDACFNFGTSMYDW